MMRLAGAVIAVLSGIGDGVTHLGKAALVDQVNDQLHLVDALEVSVLRRVASLDQGLEASRHQLGRRRRTGQHCSPNRSVSVSVLKVDLEDASSGRRRYRQRKPAPMSIALPEASCYTQTRSGTPWPSTYWERTVWPGPFGAIMITSTSAGGTICLKWMLKPCAKASTLPRLQVRLYNVLVDVSLLLVRGSAS